MVWIEIIKPISSKPVGHIQQWSERKAKAMIESGCGKKVSGPKKEDKPKRGRPAKVETATLPTPKAVEKAVIEPVIEKKFEVVKQEVKPEVSIKDKK